MSSVTFECFVASLEAMYTAMDNDTRRAHTQRVLEQEAVMSSEDVLRIGMDLLRVENYGVAVQAYGAFLLRRAVASERLGPCAVPYEALLEWYLKEPALSRPLAAALIQLLVECAVRVWPDAWPGLLPALCPPDANLAHNPRKLLLLRALIEAVTGPVGAVPLPRMRPTRAAVSAYGHTLLATATQALYEFYTAGTNHAADVSEELVGAALALFAAVGPLVPVAQWWSVGAGTTLAALVRWPPAAPDALAAAAALLRCEALRSAAAESDGGGELPALVTAALAGAEQAVEQRNWLALEAAAELMRDMPDVILRDEKAMGAVRNTCVVMLGMPSLLFVLFACTVLLRLGRNGLAQMDITELITLIARPVLRSHLHPVRSANPEHRAVSGEQYGTVENFELAFAEFRGAAGRLLTEIAVVSPEKSNCFVLGLINDLNSTGTVTDPRTEAGYVTQKSVTFEEWEATQFVVEHLAEAFRHSSVYLAQATTALVSKQPHDMVLCPVFLNILSAFWKCGDDAALDVWDGTFTILFACIERPDFNPADPDDTAARRRAFTLLVTACAEHAARFMPLSKILMERLEQLRVSVSTKTPEKTLLYEAMAALTVVFPPDEAELHMRTLLEPIISLVRSLIGNADQDYFNRLVIGCVTNVPGSQETLRNSLVVIAGILRRLPNTPYVADIVTNILPLLTVLMELAHGVRTEDLPIVFRSITEMDQAEREQLLPGRRRKSDLRTNSVRRARHVLSDTRLALYQLLAAFHHLIPDAVLENIMDKLSTSMVVMQVHAVRQLAIHCLFPVSANHPGILPHVLHCFGAFFNFRAENKQLLENPQNVEQDKGANQRGEDDDVVEMRQLFPLTKDLFVFMRKHVMDGNRGCVSPDIRELSARVAFAVMKSGANVLDGAQMVLTVMGNSGDDFALAMFGQMVDFATEANEVVLPARFRDRFVTILADSYISRFPALSEVLLRRFEPDVVEELHAYISMTTRSDLRRLRFKEVIMSPKRI